jgi:CheY-like chemotaxis protein
MKISRILIIEDEPSVLDAMSMILKDSGFRTRCAATGLAAMKEATRLNFDLAIIDLRLPDLSGLTVLESLLQHHPNLKAVLISAYELPEARNGAPRGVVGMLAKPFQPSALVDLVQGALAVRGVAGRP